MSMPLTKQSPEEIRAEVLNMLRGGRPVIISRPVAGLAFPEGMFDVERFCAAHGIPCFHRDTASGQVQLAAVHDYRGGAPECLGCGKER